MKKIKKFWDKSLRTKGAIIGIVFGLLILTINLIGPIGIPILSVFHKISGFFILPIVYIILNVFRNCNDLFCLILIIPIYLLVPVFYGLVGFLIGSLIEKMRKKK